MQNREESSDYIYLLLKYHYQYDGRLLISDNTVPYYIRCAQKYKKKKNRKMFTSLSQTLIHVKFRQCSLHWSSVTVDVLQRDTVVMQLIRTFLGRYSHISCLFGFFL